MRQSRAAGAARATRALLAVLGLAVGLAGPALAASGPGPTGSRFDPPPGSPAGTVGRVGPYLVDDEGRALLLHGITVPVADVVGSDELAVWVREGINAVRLVVPVLADGDVPALRTLPAAVATYADRGFRVVVRLDPASTRSLLTQQAAAALAAVAGALRDAPDLVGFEIAVPGAVDPTALASAVAGADPYHPLWQELPAAFDPGATVAAAGAAAYVVTWGDERLSTVRRIYTATQTAATGWFYDRETVGQMVAELIRPYPSAVAGTPTGFTGARDGSFTLSYRPTGPDGAALAAGTASAVALPASIYSTGYVATVVGGEVTSAPGAPVLCVVAAPSAATVSVSVSLATAGAGVPLAVAPSVSACEAAPAVATGGGSDGSSVDSGSEASGATGATGQPVGSDSDDVALLVLFPLVGAVATAVLLGGAVAAFRPRRRPDGVQSSD